MKATSSPAKSQIENNILVHDKIAKKYDAAHGEIFSDREQNRLKLMLTQAIALVQTSAPLQALDFGCGSGNLTRHLLTFGLHVTAADVSQNFLDLVKYRYATNQLSTFTLNGRDLTGIENERFDFIALYSVLHHIPDYLDAIRELCRVCKPGGVVYIDHENNDEFWAKDPEYRRFTKKALRTDWKKYFVFSNYIFQIKKLFNPRITIEGDIHVWPDDHIEWKKVEQTMIEEGFEVVLCEDYLVYRSLYRLSVYNEYDQKITDTRVMAFRKIIS